MITNKKDILKRTNERLKLYIARKQAKKRIEELRAIQSNSADCSNGFREPHRDNIPNEDEYESGDDHYQMVSTRDELSPSAWSDYGEERSKQNNRAHCLYARGEPQRDLIPHEDEIVAMSDDLQSCGWPGDDKKQKQNRAMHNSNTNCSSGRRDLQSNINPDEINLRGDFYEVKTKSNDSPPPGCFGDAEKGILQNRATCMSNNRESHRDLILLRGNGHEVKSNESSLPGYSVAGKKQTKRKRSFRNNRVHCLNVSREPHRVTTPRDVDSLACHEYEGVAKGYELSPPACSGDFKGCEDDRNPNSAKNLGSITDLTLHMFLEEVTETRFLPVPGMSEDADGLNRKGDVQQLSVFQRAVRKVKSVFSMKKRSRNNRTWSGYEPAFFFLTSKTTPQLDLPDFAINVCETVVHDPMSYMYNYVYRDGKPVVIDRGNYGCMFLVERQQMFYALKVFCKESSSLYEVRREVEVFQFVNGKGIGPHFRGLFPLEENAIHYSWGVLFDFAGSNSRCGRTLREILSDYEKETPGFTSLRNQDWLDILITICEQINTLNGAGVVLRAVNPDSIVVIKVNGLYKGQFLDFRDATLLTNNPCTTHYGDFIKVCELMVLINWETQSNKRFHNASQLMSQGPENATWEHVIEALRTERSATCSLFKKWFLCGKQW